MAAYIELYLDQGADFNNVINLTDDITNIPVNVAGYIITSQMRRSYYSSNITANITCTITDASNGEIVMSLTSANTSNIKAGRYVFDIKTKDQINTVSRVLEGIITVTPQVTK